MTDLSAVMDQLRAFNLKMPELIDEVGDVERHLDLDGVPEDVAKYAKTRVGETDESKALAIDELRELVYERGEVTPLRMDDDYLMRFLRARNFKFNSAYKLLVNYCKFREENMDYYAGVNPLDLFHLADTVLSSPPYRDQNGRRILIFRIGNWEPSKCPIEEVFKATVGALEAGVLEPRTQILGGVAVFDLEGMTLQHALYFTPSIVSKIIQIMMTSFPMKIYSIHIINESWMFEKIFCLFKPFLGAKQEEVVHFHGGDLESLHKHIEPKFLPTKYGGIRPEYSCIDWFIALANQEKVVKAMDELGYDLKFDGDLETKLNQMKARKT